MGIRKGYVDAKGIQIHYRRCGASKGLPLVFLHQTASSSQMFEKLMGELEAEYTMFALDNPGFGQSDFPLETPTTRYYVETLLEALGHLGIEQFHVFGHHTGACLGCEMAAIHPERVKSLMMVGPVYMGEAERRRWKDEYVDPMVIQADGSHLMKIWKRVQALDPNPSPVLCHREAVDNLRAGERYHDAYLAVFDLDFPAFLEQVRCPTLMLCGERDVLISYFEAACNALPTAKNALLPGGTYVVDDFPQKVAEQIREFLHPL